MTSSGFPESGIPMKDAAICVGCELFFRASDSQCPSCGTTLGWMLLPTKFTAGVQNDEARANHDPGLDTGRRDDASGQDTTLAQPKAKRGR